MRDNTNIVQLESSNVITIDTIPKFDFVDYDLTNEKDMRRYFLDVERICRNSNAYKKMVRFLREHCDMNCCSFYENINNIDTYSIKIHIHHSPLTLFDIVSVVFRKRLANKEPININLVAKEVMYLHYRMMVGLIPLSETVHELTHSGYLFIPTNVVYGKFKEFIDLYKDYIDPQLESTLSKAEEYTQSYDYAKETKLLQLNMVHLDVSGAYSLPKTEDVVNILKNHIKEIDSKLSNITISGDVNE